MGVFGRGAVLAAAVALASGCSVVAGAFAHHNSRGSACQSWYLPPAIDAFIGGAWAVGLAVAEEDAGWGWAGPGVFLGTAVIGTILVERCRAGSSSARAERQREKLRHSDDASIGTPQPIRGHPPSRPVRRPLPDSPPPPPPPGQDDGERPGSLRLRQNYVVKDPSEVEEERLERAKRGELECGGDGSLDCPAGFSCLEREGVGRCVAKPSD